MIRPDDYAKSNTEHAHQVALFMWASHAKTLEPRLEWMHAIPNGGLRDKRTAGRLKAEGVKQGVSDVFLPVPMMDQNAMRLDYCGLYIELKRIKSFAHETGIARAKGILSEKQEKFKAYANSVGYRAVECYGWKSAISEICLYLYCDWKVLNQYVEEKLNGK
jgi:hypothetical protein